MSVATVTVTANLGPGRSVSGLVLSNVTNVSFDFSKQVVDIVSGGTDHRFQLSDVDTVTFTFAAAGGDVAITIEQE